MKYLIVGNCAAGVNAAIEIRKRDNNGEITILSDENFPAYWRCLISYYLAGVKTKDDLVMYPESFYKDMNINVLLNKRAVKIDTGNKKVVCADGTEFSYDRLLIATGGRPKLPEIKGVETNGVFCFRSIQDARRILEIVKSGGNKAVLLGGGLIGLKATYGLKKRGLDVTLVVKSSQILSQIVDKTAAGIVQSHLEKNGVKIKLGLDASEINGNGRVRSIKLEDGSELPADIIIIGKGVSSNLEIAQGTGLKTNLRIIVNSYLETNLPGIYAAGDVAETKDLLTGISTINALWTAAVEQGKIAGANMAGDGIEYEGSMAMNSAEFFDLPLISFGITRPKPGEGYEEIIKPGPESETYKKIVLKDNKLVGAILVRKIENAGIYLALARKKVDVSRIKDILGEDSFNFSKVAHLLDIPENYIREIATSHNLSAEK